MFPIAYGIKFKFSSLLLHLEWDTRCIIRFHCLVSLIFYGPLYVMLLFALSSVTHVSLPSCSTFVFYHFCQSFHLYCLRKIRNFLQHYPLPFFLLITTYIFISVLFTSVRLRDFLQELLPWNTNFLQHSINLCSRLTMGRWISRMALL